MSTGTPFVPTPFTTTVVAPSTVNSTTRTVPYLSPREYRFAPTAVGSRSLVAGSTNQDSDSLASLAQIIERATSWADLHCFHRADGSLGASQTVESDWVKVKGNGTVALICNFKPVLEVTGMGLGQTPSQVADVASNMAQNIWIKGKVIYLTTVTVPTSTGTTFTFPSTTSWGTIYAVWSYINGFANTKLTANASKGDTSLTVQATNGSLVAGVYAGTQLKIHDGTETEVVTLAATPTNNVLSLTSGLQFDHKVPVAPDFIRVSAMPGAIDQAMISLINCLVKIRGARAQVMPTMPGGVPTKQAMAEAGALEDFEIAADLLEPFLVTYLH